MRALVVSHRPLVRAAIAYVLVSYSGCAVTEVATPEDAFHLACRISPSLVFLDLDITSEKAIRAMALRVLEGDSTAKILAYGGSDPRPLSHSRMWHHVPSEAPISAIISAVGELIPAQRAKGRLEISPRLTPRQMQVLALVALGRSNSEISELLFLSAGTVKRHLHETFERLDAKSRVDAVNRARTLGLAI